MVDKKSPIKTIPVEEIAKFPGPGNIYPGEFNFSPDGEILVFLKSENNSLSMSLFSMNVKTKELKLLHSANQQETDKDLTLAEKLRRERQRQMNLGVAIIGWAEKCNKLLFKDSTGVFVINFNKNEIPVKIIDLKEKFIIDPQISPDGNWIGYVFNNEVCITSLIDQTTKQLTFGAKKNGFFHGLAEYVAQEEMGRSHGYWWSPDSSHIAFTEVNEEHIPLFKTIHQSKDVTDEEYLEEMRYPFAGEKNAIVKLGVVAIDTLNLTWMDLGVDEDIYLTRVNWFTNSILTAQVENREQSLLQLLKFNISSGTSSVLLEERSEIWINLHNLLKVLPSDKYPEQFIWASERTGFMHLYLYDFNGKLLQTLTTGEYQIEEITGFDKEKGIVYVISTAESPVERHCYTISFSNLEQHKITVEKGIHALIMDKNCNYYVESFTSIDTPVQISLKSIQTNEDFKIPNFKDPLISVFQIEPPEIVKLTLSDNTDLYGAIYKPSIEFGSGPFPTIVFVYGGPHAQLVTNNWLLTSSLRIQNLRKQGYLVFVLDNRGSAHRGVNFESSLKYKFGHTEVDDQVFGVEWLINQGLADKNRVGIIGWSYGGYMTLMCLSKAPHIFKAGFAGAPTNDMRDYDTFYTERYMGNPKTHAEDYEKISVVNNIKNMTGKLCIAHGLIDENVLFRHTAKIINALIKYKKDYSFALFPDGRHSLRKIEDRIYLEEKILQFFNENL